MNREVLLKSIKPLSWESKGTKETGSLISVRSGKVYIIGRSSKGGFKLTIRDYLRGDSFTECETKEEAIQRANDIMKYNIIKYFNIEE